MRKKELPWSWLKDRGDSCHKVSGPAHFSGCRQQFLHVNQCLFTCISSLQPNRCCSQKVIWGDLKNQESIKRTISLLLAQSGQLHGKKHVCKSSYIHVYSDIRLQVFYKYFTYRFFRIASNKGKQLFDENCMRRFISALPLH